MLKPSDFEGNLVGTLRAQALARRLWLDDTSSRRAALAVRLSAAQVALALRIAAE